MRKAAEVVFRNHERCFEPVMSGCLEFQYYCSSRLPSCGAPVTAYYMIYIILRPRSKSLAWLLVIHGPQHAFVALCLLSRGGNYKA
jgi:hypothetical protein